MIAVGLTTSATASISILNAYLWKARPVVLFAGDPAGAAASDQLRTLQRARADLDLRDMPVFVVLEKTVTTLAGERAPATLRAGDLRAAYGIEPGAFGLVLIGKDGGEKFRSAAPVEARRLFDIVDSMPMRREEMR